MSLIESLLQQRAAESDTLDFKRDSYTESGEFCKDVCAFANSKGGRIVLGIAEDQHGFAESGVGLSGSLDDEISKLSSWLREHIEPNPDNSVKITPEVYLDKNYIVIDIIESARGPHRLNHRSSKLNRNFYVRYQRDSVPATVPEIRDLFVGRERTSQQIDRFMSGERSFVVPGSPFYNPPVLIRFTLCPLTEFGSRSTVDWFLDRPDLKIAAAEGGFGPFRPNADGVFSESESGIHKNKIQILHNSCAVLTLYPTVKGAGDDVTTLSGTYLRSVVQKVLIPLIKVLEEATQDNHFFLYIDIEQLSNCYLHWGDVSDHVISPLSVGETVHLPSLTILTSSTMNERNIAKEVLDFIWRVWGEHECPLI